MSVKVHCKGLLKDDLLGDLMDTQCVVHMSKIFFGCLTWNPFITILVLVLCCKIRNSWESGRPEKYTGILWLQAAYCAWFALLHTWHLELCFIPKAAEKQETRGKRHDKQDTGTLCCSLQARHCWHGIACFMHTITLLSTMCTLQCAMQRNNLQNTLRLPSSQTGSPDMLHT